MTATAPRGSAAGDPLRSHGTPARRRRGGRRWLIAGVLAILALVGFTLRAFASEGGFTASRIGRAADCGELDQCIPGLRTADVIAPLDAAGHTCERDELIGDTCTLEIGFTIYTTSLLSTDQGDGITGLMADIYRPEEGQAGGFPEDAPPPAGALPYFSWLASIPYGNDATGRQEISTWVRQQIEAGQDAEIQFGDYRYEVDYGHPGNISLTVRAERPFRS